MSAQITGDELTAPRMLISLAATVVRPRLELWFLWALVIFLMAVTSQPPQFAGPPARSHLPLMLTRPTANRPQQARRRWCG